jgi:adenylate kinase
MSLIKVHDKYFKRYISSQELDNTVKNLAYQVARDLEEDCTPLFVGILNGSFIYAADFVRHFPKPCDVSFVKLSSYNGTKSEGKVEELIGLNMDLKGRTVIVLEDIIDTGTTLSTIDKIFKASNVKSFKIATLFFKPDVYRKELTID